MSVLPLQAQRGKAGKLKKAKAKYADQDEDDRELAMAALASAGGTVCWPCCGQHP